MTAAEMIDAASLPVSETERAERIEALREVLTRAQRDYEEQSSRMAMTSEDLARTCSL